jgi:cytochrome b pre-mRNA-processing protein 3
VRDTAERAYRQVVVHARQPAFFTEFGVPDTLDGRYEMICLHAFLYLHRLKRGRPQSAPLSQAFFDAMFADMDRGLRDVGTGDLGVGRQVKRMAQGFYGRIRAYEQGLGEGDAVLSGALERNVFGTLRESDVERERLVCWVRRAAADLASQSMADLCAGNMRFPPASIATPEGIAR